MAKILNRQRPGNSSLILSLFALIFVVLIGWVLRYQVTMTTDLVPGINGAYYPIQVRAILKTGTLGIPDFPLLFYSEALVAGLLSFFMAQNSAIMTAVRLIDLLFPVLLAIPIFLFAYSFPRTEKPQYSPVMATLLVGLIAVGNTSLLRMAGDFQKNAAALPLSLTFIYFLYQSFNHHKKRDYILAAFFFVLTCLTHIGVVALTLTMTTIMVFFSLLNQSNRKRAILITLCFVIFSYLVLSLIYIYDPVRINRLLGVVLNPCELFTQSKFINGLSGDQSSSGNPFVFPKLSLGIVLGLLGVVITVINYKTMKPAERTLLWASSLTALFFASPLIDREWSQRLAMMSFLPGLVPLIFLTLRRKWGWVIALAVLVWVGSNTFRSHELKHQRALSIEAYNELVSFKDLLSEEETLVVAAHGLEWWVAWTMETDISNRVELAVQAWDEYDAIYVIEQIDESAFGGKPGAQKPLPMQQENTPPLPFQQSQSPPSSNKPPISTTNQPKQPTSDNQPGPFNLGLAPGDATLIHQGEYFTFSLMETKPLILSGKGRPEVEGVLSEIYEESLIIDDDKIQLMDDTVYSKFGQPIEKDELALGDYIIVWGERSLLGNNLMAEYVSIRREPGAQPAEPQQLTDETVQFGPLTMVTREGWGARRLHINALKENGYFDAEANPDGVLVYSKPLEDWLTTIVVHHSALPYEKGPAEIQNLHMDKGGYSDIGYHFIIGPDGTLFQGRPLHVRGAHTQGFNTGTVGIVLLGNIEIIEPTQEQLKVLESLVIFLKDRFGITHIAGHSDFNPDITVCPGMLLHKLLPDIAKTTGLIFGIEGYIPPPWVTTP